VTRDPEDLVVADLFLAPHAAEYTAAASRLPTSPSTNWRLTYKRALANLLRALCCQRHRVRGRLGGGRSSGGRTFAQKESRMFACLLTLALACASATADDKKAEPALSGTWGKKDGELKIEFADKNVLKIVPHGDPAVIAIVCDCTVAPEG